MNILRGKEDRKPESTKTDKAGVLEAKFFRSNDNGLTRVADTAKIFLPEQFDQWTGGLCRKIVRLEDSSLLMSMYGRYEKGTKIERKYRSLAIRSTDRGKTWNYLSTIAFDRSEHERGEGFDETSLLVLADGRWRGTQLHSIRCKLSGIHGEFQTITTLPLICLSAMPNKRLFI